MATKDDVGAKEGDEMEDEKETPSASIRFAEITIDTRRSNDRDMSFAREEKRDRNEVSFEFNSCITRRDLWHLAMQDLSLDFVGIFWHMVGSRFLCFERSN